MGCADKVRKIEHNLEREGYPQPKAEHIARAIVYGQDGHHALQHKRR